MASHMERPVAPVAGNDGPEKATLTGNGLLYLSPTKNTSTPLELERARRVNTGSGYQRLANDDYATPIWVVDALLAVESFAGKICEPAPGAGHMVCALEAAGHTVTALAGDFLACSAPFPNIVTNPPFSLADAFVRHALELTYPLSGKVCLLLPFEFDCAKKRVEIFRDCSAFAAKHVLTRRIKWVNLEHVASPKKHHAWFVWDWRHRGAPRMSWIETQKFYVGTAGGIRKPRADLARAIPSKSPVKE
jgi:hypothetical protein